ncbi:3'-5' exonuclease [Sulfurimonas sp.]|uniref:exodeoxyribonuclease X C-terminal domain-containing protein n=1 Tax=Sulfurimonas sp. TaxID=2022749 RepID=UPI003D102DD4
MLVFLDIKTTGSEIDDKICALSTLHDDTLSSELINDGKKIASEASASHHISNADIKEKNSFTQSKGYKFLQELSVDDILVVHDYDFVYKILQSYGVTVYAKIVDTKRVVKHIVEDIERFDLQYLRYELQLLDTNDIVYKPLEDVVVIKSLFEYLLHSVSEEEMFELSFTNVLLQKFNFGKYNGRYIEEIVNIDPQYLHWMLSLDNLDADLQYTIQYYLQG